MGQRAAGPQYAPLHEEAPGADRKPQGGRWLLWLPVAVAGAVLYALNVHCELHYRGPSRGHLLPTPTPQNEPPHRQNRSFLVDSAGCRIPALDPWDPMVWKYVSPPHPINCSSRGRPLVASNLTALYVVEEALPDYNVSDGDDLSCCYQPFQRGPKGDDTYQ